MCTPSLAAQLNRHSPKDKAPCAMRTAGIFDVSMVAASIRGLSRPLCHMHPSLSMAFLFRTPHADLSMSNDECRINHTHMFRCYGCRTGTGYVLLCERYVAANDRDRSELEVVSGGCPESKTRSLLMLVHFHVPRYQMCFLIKEKVI